MQKKILIWSASYDPVLGGLQSITKSLAEGLRNRGYRISVLTNRIPSQLAGYQIINRIPVYRYRFYHPIRPVRSMRELFISLYGFCIYPFTLLRLIRLIRTLEPEIINIHFPSQQLWYIKILQSIFRRIVWVISLHGDEILHFTESREGIVQSHLKARFDLGDNLRLRVLRSRLHHAQAVTTCSSYLMKMTGIIMGGKKFRGYVVYNGIDFNRFSMENTVEVEGKYIFASGRLIFEKGFDILIKCFARLLEQSEVNYKLVIGGTGKELSNLKQLSSDLGLKDKIIFPGRLPPEDIVSYLQHCTLAIVSSRKEPFGISLLEAIAAGANIVSTDVGGLPEISKYGRVTLCQPNEESMFHAIEEAINKAFYPEEVETAEYKRIFTSSKMLDQFEKILINPKTFNPELSSGGAHIYQEYKNSN